MKVLTHLFCSKFSVLCNIQNKMFSGGCQWLALATHIKISSIINWTAWFLVLSTVARWCHNFRNTNTLTVTMSTKEEIKGMEYGPPDHRKRTVILLSNLQHIGDLIKLPSTESKTVDPNLSPTWVTFVVPQQKQKVSVKSSNYDKCKIITELHLCHFIRLS
jgi:hypothetical protein